MAPLIVVVFIRDLPAMGKVRFAASPSRTTALSGPVARRNAMRYAVPAMFLWPHALFEEFSELCTSILDSGQAKHMPRKRLIA